MGLHFALYDKILWDAESKALRKSMNTEQTDSL